jgi:hypothetical protein
VMLDVACWIVCGARHTLSNPFLLTSARWTLTAAA